MFPHPILVAISLGSNVGDRRGHMQFGLNCLAALPLTSMQAVSDMIETEPVGGPAQGMYLNAACLVRTLLPARTMMSAMLGIERQAGREREREVRWGPRTLDLDLLLYGNELLDEPGLTVPHPRLHERAFVLGPLAQIAPDWHLSGHGATIAELLGRLKTSSVRNRPD